MGLPLTRWLVSDRVIASAMAPIAGWAVFTALALPILTFVGFTRVTVGLLSGAAVLLSAAALLRSRSSGSVPAGRTAQVFPSGPMPPQRSSPSYRRSALGRKWAAAAWSSPSRCSTTRRWRSSPIWPGSAFRRATHSSARPASLPRLAYYYLWHFSAAAFSLLDGSKRVGSRYRADLVHRLRLADIDDGACSLAQRAKLGGVPGRDAEPRRVASPGSFAGAHA